MEPKFIKKIGKGFKKFFTDPQTRKEVYKKYLKKEGMHDKDIDKTIKKLYKTKKKIKKGIRKYIKSEKRKMKVPLTERFYSGGVTIGAKYGANSVPKVKYGK